MKALTGILSALLLVTAAGCSSGGTGTVDGVVTVDGKPLGGFEITYISQANGAAYLAYAGEAGAYQLFASRGKREIPVGDYKVTVVPTAVIDNVPRPKVQLPDKYTSESQTELVKTITKGTNQIDLVLESQR